jgi:hypothetical protein
MTHCKRVSSLNCNEMTPGIHQDGHQEEQKITRPGKGAEKLEDCAPQLGMRSGVVTMENN